MRKIKLLLLAFFALSGVSTAFAQNRAALATDGTTAQYFYNVEAGRFLLGANDWGTRASGDATKGYLCRFEPNGETFKLADYYNNKWHHLDCQGAEQIWVDGGGEDQSNGEDRGGCGTWGFDPYADGSFIIYNSNVSGYLSFLPSKNDTRLYMSSAFEAQSTWVAVSEDYFKALTAIPAPAFGEKQTSVADLLEGKIFVIQNDAEGKALCFATGNQELKYEEIATAYDTPSYMYKIEKAQGEGVTDYYYIRTLKPDGSEYVSPWGGSYLNSQKADGTTCFVLNNKNGEIVNGQDINNGAVWDIQYDETNGGFTIKNIGTGLYLNDNTPAKYDTPVYWSFIEVTANKAALSTYIPAATAAIAAYEVVKTNALRDAIHQYGPIAVFGSETLDAAALAAGVEVLNSAVEDSKAYVATIKALETYGELAKTLDDAGKAVYDVAAIQAAVDNGTLTEDKSAEIANLFYKAVRSQAPGADMTGAIVNPSFEDGTTNGWRMANAGGTANNGNFWAATGSWFVERWQNSANGGLSDGSMSQEIKDLPDGFYTLTAQMQNVLQATDPATAETGFFLTANGQKVECTKSGTVTIEDIQPVDGVITIGAALEGCTGNWVCIDNFQLTYVKALEIAYTEKPEAGTKLYIYNPAAKVFIGPGAKMSYTEGQEFEVYYKSSDASKNPATDYPDRGFDEGFYVRFKTTDTGQDLCLQSKPLMIGGGYAQFVVRPSGEGTWLISHPYPNTGGNYPGWVNDDLASYQAAYLQVIDQALAFNKDQQNTSAYWQFINQGMYDSIKAELATGISYVEKKAAPAKGIFNAAGQQMKSLQKGLNIVDGQKIYVK